MSNLYRNFFHSQISEHQLVIKKLKEGVEEKFIKVLEIWYSAVKKNRKIIFFGNGGSASDAQHLSTELTVRFSKNRKSIPAISLVTDTSTISAIGNDFGFEYLFVRQLEAIGQKGDVVVGISTSGKSKNVIKALDNKAWETYFGKKEKLGVYLKRFSQKLLHAVVIRSNVR